MLNPGDLITYTPSHSGMTAQRRDRSWFTIKGKVYARVIRTNADGTVAVIEFGTAQGLARTKVPASSTQLGWV